MPDFGPAWRNTKRSNCNAILRSRGDSEPSVGATTTGPTSSQEEKFDPDHSLARAAGATFMIPHDAMMQTLEAIADAGVDIVPLFFERLYASFPLDAANFLNPGHSHGAMANEILSMLLALADDEQWVSTMMRIQLSTHQSHGDITLERYQETLSIFVGVLREAAGQAWSLSQERAWRSQATRLMRIIARNSQKSGIAPHALEV